jgi:hypothetical protein
MIITEEQSRRNGYECMKAQNIVDELKTLTKEVKENTKKRGDCTPSC